MKIIACKNCATRYRGRYCPSCGQKARTGRLNWMALWDNLAYSVTNMDRGFLFTVKELFTRPGYMMQDYILGKRINYFRPFSMMVILTTVYVFLAAFIFPSYPTLEKMSRPPRVTEEITEEAIRSDEEEDSFRMMNINILGKRYTHDDFQKWKNFQADSGIWKMVQNLVSNPVFWLFFILFFFAFAVRLVFRRNGAKHYHYVEHLFAGAYLVCQFLIVMIVLLPYQYFTARHNPVIGYETLRNLLFIAIPAWDYRQLFRMRWVAAIFKTILLYLMTALSAVIVAVIISGIIVVLALLLNGLL